MKRLLLLAALLSFATQPARADNPVVRFTTPLGSFDVELCAELSAACPGVAPNTVANFLRYVDEGRYPATTFIHRSASDPVVIQGGGYWVEVVDEEKDEYELHVVEAFPPIALEDTAPLSNVRGTIAMARTLDPNSATSQWYVNVQDNLFLDGDYAVFGVLLDGIEAVDAIAAVQTWPFAPPFNQLPLIDYPGSPTSVLDYLVFVDVERVPEPAAGAGALAAAAGFAGLARRRSRAQR
jgi:peptidyl-prolyl cis-trans isomerase A (cyclophilin A)